MIKTDELAEKLGSKLVGQVREAHYLAPPQFIETGAAVIFFQKPEIAPENDFAVLIVPEGSELPDSQPHIAVKDPRLALALASSLFNNRPALASGIHPTALIDDSAQLADNVHVGAYTVIDAHVVVAEGTQIGSGCLLAQGTKLGKNCLVYPNVSFYAGTVVGDRAMIHSGAVLGSDGFGYAAGPKGAVKIHHLGGLKLADDVEIGANTCIDRGTLGDTSIGARSKIDNLCQIGHNVVIGTDCLIAGTVAIAGSTRLGNRVKVGGGAGMVDHISIGDEAQISARSLVTKPVPAGETWAGNPAQPYKKYVRGLYLQGRLERIWERIKGLDSD